MTSGEQHHFCRWSLPQGHAPEASRAQLFPGQSPAAIAQVLDTARPTKLREVFTSVYGTTTTSNNVQWIRNKLKTALGVGGKPLKGASPRKRAGTSGPGARGGGGSASKKKQAVRRSSGPASSPPLPAADEPWSPSTSRPSLCAGTDNSQQHSITGFVPLGPSADGAATLLAAAVEVEAGHPFGHTGLAPCPVSSGGSWDSNTSPAPAAVPLEALLGGSLLHPTLQACGAMMVAAGNGALDAPLPPAQPASPASAGATAAIAELNHHRLGHGTQLALLQLLAALAGPAPRRRCADVLLRRSRRDALPQS